MQITAAILAGGLGTRLASVLQATPKALAPVAGQPFLTVVLDQLANARIRQAVICTGYGSDQIRDAFGSRYRDIDLTYSEETEPLGTAGALRQAVERHSGELWLGMNGDSYVHTNLRRFIDWHQAQTFEASLLLTRVPDAGRFGRVEVRADGGIESFHEKQALRTPGRINAGIYLFSRNKALGMDRRRPLSIEREVFPDWIHSGLGGYVVEAPFIDIGTPESFAEATAFLDEARSGAVAR